MKEIGHYDAEKNKWTCDLCDSTRARAEADGINPRTLGVPTSCPDCKYVPRIMPENIMAVFLIRKMQPGLFTGFGGINYDAVKFIFDLYDIPPWSRRDLFDKVLSYHEGLIDASSTATGRHRST